MFLDVGAAKLTFAAGRGQRRQEFANLKRSAVVLFRVDSDVEAGHEVLYV